LPSQIRWCLEPGLARLKGSQQPARDRRTRKRPAQDDLQSATQHQPQPVDRKSSLPPWSSSTSNTRPNHMTTAVTSPLARMPQMRLSGLPYSAVYPTSRTTWSACSGASAPSWSPICGSRVEARRVRGRSATPRARRRSSRQRDRCCWPSGGRYRSGPDTTPARQSSTHPCAGLRRRA
jgi:hypothetical protein